MKVFVMIVVVLDMIFTFIVRLATALAAVWLIVFLTDVLIHAIKYGAHALIPERRAEAD